MKFIAFLTAFYSLIPFSNAAIVTIEGFRNTKGFAAVSVFHEREQRAFPGDAEKAIKTLYVPVPKNSKLEFTLDNMPAGKYAVAILHDEDGNKKLNTVLGYPREGFGFSNNPTILVGAPAFSKCAVELTEGATVKIKMKYFY
ncbi:DUF2141 domain-containing protein [Bdellovibrio sp. HCB185ZH]|uniref:DUF2141 domain-containing protein n=1 Tax=Bdellovibrio sp. HCB185ZH TaxID=3394235 RepID=UPI0039A64FBE